MSVEDEGLTILELKELSHGTTLWLVRKSTIRQSFKAQLINADIFNGTATVSINSAVLPWHFKYKNPTTTVTLAIKDYVFFNNYWKARAYAMRGYAHKMPQKYTSILS